MKYGKIFALVTAILMISVTAPLVSAELTDNDSMLKGEYASEINVHKDIQTNIFTSNYQESISSSLNKYTTKISSSSDLLDLESISSTEAMVVIDESWTLNKNQTTIEDNINILVKRGNPVVIIGESPELLMKSGRDVGFTGFSEEAQIYTMIHSPDTGAVTCISVSGDETMSTSELLARTYQMVSEALDDDVGAPVGNLSEPYKTYFEKTTSKGIMASKTTYHKLLGDNDPNYEYYLAHYRFSATPLDGHSKSKMYISNNVSVTSDGYPSGQTLYAYKPTTTAGTTTVGADLGASLEWSGKFSAGVNIGINWSHSYSDVTVVDRSLPGSEYFRLRYDINECTNAGYNTLTVEPGIIIASPVNSDGRSSCDTIDQYIAEFCDVVMHGRWHNNFTEETSFQLVSFYP